MDSDRQEVLYATLNREGQVTLPPDLREELHLREGDRLEFRLRGGEITLRPAPAPASPLQNFVGMLPLAGEADDLVSAARHTPEERADLARGPGARVMRLGDL